VIVLAALIAACGSGTGVSTSRVAATPDTIMRAPAESTLKQDPASNSIRRGRALARFTRDSLPAHVGNQLRCVSCHLADGTQAYAMPWIGAYGRFPQYRSRSGKVARLEDRINDCFRRSLNGAPLPFDGDDMRDLVAYISWLSRGTVSGRKNRGSSIDSLIPLPPDTAGGRMAYVANCSRCHGPNGEGLQGPDSLGSGPPLWGRGAYGIGSGMARIRVAAAFIHHNMPRYTPGILSAQAAFDIAGFLAARERPDYAGKELDWPNGDPPPDVAYVTKARASAPGVSRRP
jgi:thiosulfate dehydrogenase